MRRSQVYRLRRCILSMAFPVRAAFIVSCLASASMVRAGDMCPAPPKYHAPIASDIAADDHRIHIDTDDATFDADRNAVLNGRVKVRQDARSVTSDSVTYNDNTGRVSVSGSVDFEDPKLRVRSDTGHYDIDGAANFDKANFQLMDRNGRGFATDIDVLPDGKLSMTDVRYTTCPVGNEDWMLQASSLNIDSKAQEGTAHRVIMRFKDVPIFYTPYISFPMGDERKSGLLFPSFGHSGNNGFELEVPYYLNLAPNYDATLTPGLLSARGVLLGGQFRYLTEGSHGQIDTTFLPNDSQLHSDRSYFRFTDVTDFKRGMRFDTDIAGVSDSQYFEDFAVGSDQTSVTFLERRADILYYDDVWRVRGELQNFQTIDITLPTTCAPGTAVPAGFCDERPYSRVPRIEGNALWPMPGTNFEFALDSEAVNFIREVGLTGVRLNVAPDVRWSTRGPGYFFEPAIGYDFTQYDLEHAVAGAALCALGHGVGVRARRRLAGPTHPDLRASLGLQLRALPQPRRPADIRYGTARPESHRAVSHQSLRGRGPHRRHEPGGPRADHAFVRSRLRGAVPVGHHRPNPLFHYSAGLSARGCHHLGVLGADRGDGSRCQSLGPARSGAGQRAGSDVELRPRTICLRAAHSDPRRPWGRGSAEFPRLGHRRRRRRDGLQAFQLQFRLPVEPLHLANRQVGGLDPVPPGPHPGGEHRLPLSRERPGSVGHPEAMGRVVRLADRGPLEHRRALGLFPGGPQNHRASGWF